MIIVMVMKMIDDDSGSLSGVHSSPAQGETGCGLEGNRHHLQIQDDHSGVGDDVVGNDDDDDDDDDDGNEDIVV